MSKTVTKELWKGCTWAPQEWEMAATIGFLMYKMFGTADGIVK